MSHVDKDYIEQYGVPEEVGIDLLHKWFTKLGLGPRRRIIPLAHNWKFDCQFISNWMGFDAYQEMFDGRHRDSLSLAISINDAYECAGLDVPYPKQNLTAMCGYLDVKLDKAHRAIEDASATIEVYKKLAKRVAANL